MLPTLSGEWQRDARLALRVLLEAGNPGFRSKLSAVATTDEQLSAVILIMIWQPHGSYSSKAAAADSHPGHRLGH